MSNSSDSSDQNNSSNKSLRWSFIQNDLSSALNAWQELEQKQTNLSPDEEQMVKIKSIIGQLREKLEQF
ncbi:MAG: hypothetical protein ACXWQQ_13720 [Pseudobdellovibrio sp.]